MASKVIHPVPFRLSFLLFLIFGVMAIVKQEAWLVCIPFLLVLTPLAFGYATANMERLYWCMLFVLPLSTELLITPSLGMDFPDELLMMILTGMALMKFVHRPGSFPRAVLQSPLSLLLFLHLLWILFSCIYAQEQWLAIKFFLAKIWFIVPFVILPSVWLHTKKQFATMAKCLLIPMLAVTCITLVRHAYFSFTFADLYKTMVPFFRNHVNYSSMLVCLLPVTWCAYILTPSGTKKKWIGYGMLIGLTGLIFAYSRGAWLALFAGLLTAWMIRKQWLKIFLTVLFIILAGAVSWLITDRHYMHYAPDHDHTVFHPDFGEHLVATVELKDVSNAERFYRWVAGARMLSEKPWTGFGPNSFYPYYKAYTVRGFETWVSDNPEHSTVHNYFLLTAAEQGVPGLIVFCILYIAMLLRAERLYHRLQDNFYRMSALTIGIILAMTGVINFLSDMLETDKTGSLFWLCLGLIIVLEQKHHEEKKGLTPH